MDFEFVARPVENENEKQEIHEKMKKYLELKILKRFKRKKKRAAWKERMKIISDEKALNKKKKEARKFKKMTKKQRDAFEEKRWKKATKKKEILMKRLASKRVRAPLEYNRSRSILPVETLDSVVTPDPGPFEDDMQPVEKVSRPA